MATLSRAWGAGLMGFDVRWGAIDSVYSSAGVRLYGGCRWEGGVFAGRGDGGWC